MRLFLLSLLAIGSVQSLSIGYPYRSVWNNNPFFARLPLKSGVVHGHLRYLDGIGIERAFAYNGHKPVYAVHQFKYLPSETPVQKSSPSSKFDLINFRYWTTLQHQHLKYEIDILRAEGKEPTPEMLTKLQTLEKIVIAPSFSTVADLPEVKDIVQDYEQAISSYKDVESSNIKQNQGEIKTYTGNSNIPLVAIEESPETKQAREELLRIYNEKTAHLKQLVLEHQKNVKEQPENVKQVDNEVALAELERAQQEHIRSWTTLQYQNLKHDIDILRAEGKEPTPEILKKFQALEKIINAPNFSIIADLPEVKDIMQDYEQAISLDEAVQSSNIKQNQGEIKTYTGNSNIPLVAIEESPETKQAREEHLRIYNEQIAHLKQLELEHQKNVKEQSESVKQVDNAVALAELERAQQEHFRLWNEAKLRAEQAGYDGGAKTVYESAEKQQISAQTNNQNTFNLKQNQELQSTAQTESVKTTTNQQSSRSDSSSNDQTLVQPQQVVVRDEHSRLVDSSSFQGLKSNIPVAQQALLPQPVAETPEVIRAREEHLRIVNEAVSRAQAVQQEEEKQRQQRIEQSSVDGSEGQAIHHLSHNVEQQQLKSEFSTADYGQQSHVVETPEVIKAREEHLRLVQEANLRAQFVEQQELKYKHQSQTPILKTQYPHEQLEYHSQIAQTGVPETLDVTNAREQHSRLVTEINSKPNSDVQLVEQQRSVESHGIEDTPEVKRAREEHLRIYNAIKNQVEQEKSLKDERKSSEAIVTQQLGQYSTEEERLLEMERLRETERLQKEQQLLEMERLREAERLAEEKRNMEAELIRLRIEDEQRLEMERLLELQRLQQEQEELQKIKSEGYQEIIIQDTSAYQQPQQIAIVSNEQLTGKSSASNVNVQSTTKYGHNPYLRVSPVVNEHVYTVPLQHSVNHQQEISAFAHSPFLKSSAVNVPGAIHHHQTVGAHVNEQFVNEPSVRYVQSPQHSGGGNKHQHIKDDHYVKHKYQDNASNQPADTAEALFALERATKDHFRAHELALEQLRLARLQNPQLKDCN